MANQSMTVQAQKVANFKGLVNTQAMVKRMTTACGGEKEGKQFMASILDLYETEKSLQDCDPQKVLAECLKAAALNLPIVKSLGYTYVVPFKSNPTFIIGYKGLIQLAQRSGQYRYINADAVYEGEELSFDRVTGKLAITGEKTSDKATGYFAYFQLTNGFEKSFYMDLETMTNYAKKYSPSYNSSSSPWHSNFDAMAKKTVLRQVLKYGPMSTDMQTAEVMEVESAAKEAQAEADKHANRGPVVDILDVDQATGEVITDMEEPEPDGPDF